MRSKSDLAPRLEIRKAARSLISSCIRVYLAAYVRYLCRTKSHLCRLQNKLLIIEIRRISLFLFLSLSFSLSSLRKWFTHVTTRCAATARRRICSFWQRTKRVADFIMRDAARYCHRHRRYRLVDGHQKIVERVSCYVNALIGRVG